ncbi:uncharacterized protein LOC128713015 [Anopheles marshallii]|uniref:uncharacterized protein LOC128713015 n=1 Tax=Anopheles marshallii TaxID=1521116 RepID=UPI00237BD279|nr:uncharacterized protein LOC128713015 [Anopheles marshallii]
MSLVLSDIPEEELKKFRFILKLWIVTNDPSIEYLRWNRDQTVLIANILSLMHMFRTHTSNIFMCESPEKFIWLMYKHGFDRCIPLALEESERNEITPECMLFVHPQFIGSNAKMFDAWLSHPAVRVQDENGQKGRCTLPSSVQFMVRENIAEFTDLRLQVMFTMINLQSKLWEPMRGQESASIEIPQEFVDYPVMEMPDYFKTQEIGGNYGPVSVDELKQCLGNLLPRFRTDESENATDVMEEVEVEELAVNEISQADDAVYVVLEPGAMENETPVNQQFNDLRELYESLDIWTDAEGNLLEYQANYKIDDETTQVVNNDSLKEEAAAESSHPVLPTQPAEADVSETKENMAAYLTKSMQACLPAIDFD